MSTALAKLLVILRRDATDTTYKYALLRALIDIADELDHLVDHNSKDWVTVPVGLVIGRWLLYYFPLIAAGLPQRHGADPIHASARNIVFWSDLERLVARYRNHGGFTAFATELKHGHLRADDPDIRALLIKVRHTIVDKPMRHLGVSVFRDQYQVTSPNQDCPRLTANCCRAPLDLGFLVANFGTFRLRREFYDVFRALGGFVNGTDAVLYQWAQFVSRALRSRSVSVQSALQSLLLSPNATRAVREARQAYVSRLNAGSIECVWSGRPITTEATLAIDHVIPFSLWGNNDLWNLLPSHVRVNAAKRDRIPAPKLLRRRRTAIAEAWVVLRELHPDAFDRELHASLTGFGLDARAERWTDAGIDALADKCNHLIIERGFEVWNP